MTVMHERAAERQRARLRLAAEDLANASPDRVARARRDMDVWLDYYADSLLRVTEWDADQWGFDPDRWMEKERVELTKRGGQNWPREVI